MIEVLEFIFQDFEHWLGTLLLLEALSPSIRIVHKDRER